MISSFNFDHSCNPSNDLLKKCRLKFMIIKWLRIHCIVLFSVQKFINSSKHQYFSVFCR